LYNAFCIGQLLSTHFSFRLLQICSIITVPSRA
jgi:hypothetical protein